MNSKNKNHGPDRLLETLKDHYQAQRPVAVGRGWRDSVMAYVLEAEARRAREPLTGFGNGQAAVYLTRVLWRFTGVTAAISAVMVLLFFVLGGGVDFSVLAGFMLDPLSQLGILGI